MLEYDGRIVSNVAGGKKNLVQTLKPVQASDQIDWFICGVQK